MKEDELRCDAALYRREKGMNAQTCVAVFENGIFRPVTALPPNLTEGQYVRLVVETKAPEDVLELAAQVYRGLSEQQIDEIEQVALDRRDFFSRTES